jgi:hypothetical protein
MALSIDWATKVISIPKTDLTLIQGTLYELNTNEFRLWLKDIEDSEEGMPYEDTHRHNTEVTVAGVTYARVIEIINGYSITFEDGQYSVRLVGSNNNIWDIQNGILNQNQVQVIPTNSAGLIVSETGTSGLTPEESAQLLALPDLGEIEASDVLAKEDSVAALPILAEIEASPVLAKEATVSARPTLTEIEGSATLAKQAELLRALGLMQENYYLDQTSYQDYEGIKLLTSGRLRLYSVAGSVGTDSDVLATYQITATWSGMSLTTYKVVKQ